ncbi:MAG: hypothetical protein ACE5G3_04120 [Gammaproteobacteria bacterium]
MHTLSIRLYRLASGGTVALSVSLYAIFLIAVMAPESERVKTYAGEWGSPDGHLFYTPAEFYGEIGAWGDTGRAHYVDFRLGLDPVWALVYTAFLVTITSVALRRAFTTGDRRRLLNLVALLPLLADLTENALGIALVSAYPARLDWLAWLTTAVSAFKWTTLGVAHLVMLYAVTAALATRFRPARN